MNKESSKKKLKNHIEETKNIRLDIVSFIFAFSQMTHEEYILYIENEFEKDMKKLKKYIKENSDKHVWSMGGPIQGISRENWLKFHRSFVNVAESLGPYYDLGFSIPDPSSPGFSISGGYKYTFDGLNMYSGASMNEDGTFMYIFTIEK